MATIKTTIYPKDYFQRLREYNQEKNKLAKQREEFYKANPDFPFDTMYIQVTPPPCCFIIREIS